MIPSFNLDFNIIIIIINHYYYYYYDYSIPIFLISHAGQRNDKPLWQS